MRNSSVSYYINKSVIIRDQQIIVDGEVLFESSAFGISDFLRAAYKNLKIDYPKYYKMDNLCKLAFIAAEHILGNDTSPNTALLFANREASTNTDVQYQKSIGDPGAFYPSPAVFVYTLANIAVGEISIRHDLKSENAFFVAKKYPALYVMTLTNYLLSNNKADAVLCGWLKCEGENYEAQLYLVKPEGKIQHSEENIQEIIGK